MAKVKNQYYKPYMQQRKRIQGIIYRARKAGYTVNYVLPNIPKNITEASIRRLQSITAKYVREKSTFTTSEGKKVSAQITQNIRRLESAKRGAQTRKINRQRFITSFDKEYGVSEYLPEPRLWDENKLPKNIQWNQDVQAYVNYETGEVINTKDLPNVAPIVMSNYVKEFGEQILPVDIFRGLEDMLANPEQDDDWYKRRTVVKAKSFSAAEKLAQRIHDIIQNNQANKVYYRNLVEAGKYSELQTAINKVIKGYSESDVSQGYQDAVAILTGGKPGEIMSASEYALREDTYD